jgi:hypothetical protein
MHASKAYACPIVKGNSVGIFRIPGTLYDRSKEKVPCASAVGSIISAQKNLP